ncbi:MAG: hypothetical protein HOD40_10765, partial [Chloroflexi bacterium]|nr:hypothetical protein [Chloroflexota bacterium]
LQANSFIVGTPRYIPSPIPTIPARGVCNANSKPTVSPLAHPAIYPPQIPHPCPGSLQRKLQANSFTVGTPHTGVLNFPTRCPKA